MANFHEELPSVGCTGKYRPPHLRNPGMVTPCNTADPPKEARNKKSDGRRSALAFAPARPFTQAPATIVAEAKDLSAFMGDVLTHTEISAVKAVSGRLLPMAALPANTTDVARIPYRQRVYHAERPRSARHYGQRKLLNSEILFLLGNARKNDTVVYAGAAPGIHIPFLASLFCKMNLRYILIDPRPFDLPWPKNTKTGAPIELAVRRGLFTDETAREFAGRDDVLFISDIRSGTDEPEIPSDETVELDMAQQENWVLTMNPRASLLKYRLNYTKSANTLYLAGDVRIQNWPGGSSTETRLESKRPYARTFVSAQEHEERMFFINNILREWAAYDHGVPLDMVPGLDDGFDSACEVRTWRRYIYEYLAKMDGQKTDPIIVYPAPGEATQIADLIARSSAALRRGLDPSEGPLRRL